MDHGIIVSVSSTEAEWAHQAAISQDSPELLQAGQTGQNSARSSTCVGDARRMLGSKETI
jgi:hypothetical protein